MKPTDDRPVRRFFAAVPILLAVASAMGGATAGFATGQVRLARCEWVGAEAAAQIAELQATNREQDLQISAMRDDLIEIESLLRHIRGGPGVSLRCRSARRLR
jgi:hypothetical protein